MIEPVLCLCIAQGHNDVHTHDMNIYMYKDTDRELDELAHSSSANYQSLSGITRSV